jgi:hypothetical protein
VGGRTHTRWGPAGLQLMLASPTSGNPSCGGCTYPDTSGTHVTAISILDPAGKMNAFCDNGAHDDCVLGFDKDG